MISPDQNSSRGDLESALTVPGLLQPEELEVKLLEVFQELEYRVDSARESYPFEVVGARVHTKDRPWEDYSAYLFCLCLSYFHTTHRLVRTWPDRIFEALCTEVARRYIGGDAVRFGFPRVASEIEGGFRAAVDTLSKNHILEGDGFKLGSSYHWSKDDNLDVVAWRHENDRLPGKLLLFGACATGRNWETKVGELRPDVWISTWLVSPVYSPVIKAFFIPHRIDRRRWALHARFAGIIFDRCRIAAWVSQIPHGSIHGNAIDWAMSTLSHNMP